MFKIKMLRQLSFLGITTLAIIGLYNFHTLTTYLYYNYCCGLGTGTPPCLYLLELMYISVNGVKSFWIYLGTLASGLFVYAFNNLYSEISNIHSKLDVKAEDIEKNRLVK
jgi:hypothetical protein